uniref:Ig-like domain-containing protein n=1 Tax=Cyanistes caeruleus TaxID=156563 RepID=A0A8C0VNG8_CYACU
MEGEKHVSISFDVFAEPSEEERVEFRAEDSESCSFEFQVTEAPPRFVRLISDYSTFVGASVCFQCLVSGSPRPSVCWYKDGVLLEGDRYCEQEEQNDITRSLIVSSEEGRNEGYSSGLQLPDREKTLEFELGKPVYFSKAKMKIEDEGKAPVFLKQVSDVEVWQGDVARLSVTVTGSPTPKIQWFLNSTKLIPCTDCKLVFAGNDHSLILPYAGVQDEGEYTCVASNVHGETSCSAQLHVRQRKPGFPCFAREPDSVRCAPGFTAVFEYTVVGKPCPDVLWSKGSEQLFSDARHSIAHRPDGSGSLTVWDCVEEDTGLYTCRAVSALGEATCSAELLVLPKERVVTLEPAELVKGTNPILQCEVAGTGPFEISWYKDKKQIRSSKKYRLTSQKAVISLEVSSFNSADVGEYECVIANEVGKCMCSATYILKGQDWEKPYFIKLHFAEGSASLEIKHLDANDAGVYICRATNSAGSKESSSTLFIKGLAICFIFLGILLIL